MTTISGRKHTAQGHYSSLDSPGIYSLPPAIAKPKRGEREVAITAVLAETGGGGDWANSNCCEKGVGRLYLFFFHDLHSPLTIQYVHCTLYNTVHCTVQLDAPFEAEFLVILCLCIWSEVTTPEADLRSRHSMHCIHIIGTERKVQVRPPSSIFEQYEQWTETKCITASGS
jgi:hypothetical protein